MCIRTKELGGLFKDEPAFVRMGNPTPAMEKRSSQEPTASRQNCRNWELGVPATPHTCRDRPPPLTRGLDAEVRAGASVCHQD